MKWLVLSVLLSNGLMFYWYFEQRVIRPGAEEIESLSAGDGRNGIVLLSELVELPQRGSIEVFERVADSAEKGADEMGLERELILADGVSGQGKVKEYVENIGAALGEITSPLSDVGQEQEQEQEKEKEQKVVQANEKALHIMESELYCVRLGRFDSEERAAELLEEIKSSVDIEGNVNSVVEGMVRHLVYVAPLGSRADAQLQQAEMIKRNIDSFIYYKGPLKNGLSLGYFASIGNAERMRENVEAAGYEAVSKAVTVKVTRYWIELEKADLAKLSMLFWEDIARMYPGVLREEIPCSMSAKAGSEL